MPWPYPLLNRGEIPMYGDESDAEERGKEK